MQQRNSGAFSGRDHAIRFGLAGLGSVDLLVKGKKMASTTQFPSKAVITSVGGAIGGGNANSTKPVITGTADAGTTINIYDGVRLLGTTTVAANGTWTFTPTADLKGGTHSFTVISVDSQGNYGTSSEPMSVAVGSTAPAAPVIVGLIDSVGPVQGVVANNGVTDDPRPALRSWTARAIGRFESTRILIRA
jgi:large repetitive protein